MSKKIIINKSECNNCCECVDIAPDIFDINSDGVFVQENLNQHEELETKIQFAIYNCKQFCLSWQEEISTNNNSIIKEETSQNTPLNLTEGLAKLKALNKNYLLKPLHDDSFGIWYHHEQLTHLLYPYIPYGVNSIDFCYSDNDDQQYEIVEMDLTETYQIFASKQCYGFDHLMDKALPKI